MLFETLSLALFSSLPSYPPPVNGRNSYFNFCVAAHLDAVPTGPPCKCQAARRPSPPIGLSLWVWSSSDECFEDTPASIRCRRIVRASVNDQPLSLFSPSQLQPKVSQVYVRITTYQPDTESNSNPTTKQHAIVNIQLNIVTTPTYPDKFIRDM